MRALMVRDSGARRAWLHGWACKRRARLVVVEQQAGEEHVGAVQCGGQLGRARGHVAVAEHAHLHARQPPRDLPRRLRAQTQTGSGSDGSMEGFNEEF